MPRTIRYSTKKLANFFELNKRATMSELKRALGTQVDVTVFRKLKQLSYCTSYSHRGGFYTLESIAQFDELCDVLTSELEPKSYDKLFGHEEITYTAPIADDVHRSRPPH